MIRAGEVVQGRSGANNVAAQGAARAARSTTPSRRQARRSEISGDSAALRPTIERDLIGGSHRTAARGERHRFSFLVPTPTLVAAALLLEQLNRHLVVELLADTREERIRARQKTERCRTLSRATASRRPPSRSVMRSRPARQKIPELSNGRPRRSTSKSLRNSPSRNAGTGGRPRERRGGNLLRELDRGTANVAEPDAQHDGLGVLAQAGQVAMRSSWSAYCSRRYSTVNAVVHLRVDRADGMSPQKNRRLSASLRRTTGPADPHRAASAIVLLVADVVRKLAEVDRLPRRRVLQQVPVAELAAPAARTHSSRCSSALMYREGDLGCVRLIVQMLPSSWHALQTVGRQQTEAPLPGAGARRRGRPGIFAAAVLAGLEEDTGARWSNTSTWSWAPRPAASSRSASAPG